LDRFQSVESPFKGFWVLKRCPISDERGFFERLFCSNELQQFGHPGFIAQANRSLTRRQGVVRGMHFQYPPHCEWKIITCLKGVVYDVIVDIRSGSSTFLQKFSIELTENSNISLLVPPGCAHGFQTLVENCEMLYFHSHPFLADAEGGLRADDPILRISWPQSITERSLRDTNHPLLLENYVGVQL